MGFDDQCMASLFNLEKEAFVNFVKCWLFLVSYFAYMYNIIEEN